MNERILVVEDERGLQVALEDRLENEGYMVAIEGNGIKAEETIRSRPFDLIILDIMLPGRDGFQICQNIRAASIHIPILMLTARNTPLDTVVGLRFGGDDYLCKPFEMQVLIARVEALLRRARLPKDSTHNAGMRYRFGEFVLDTSGHELIKGDKKIWLSSQEYRLLKFFAENAERVVSRNELLDEVWGYETETTTRTVDVHVSTLRQKLGEKQSPKHLITLRGHGYKFIRE